MFPFCYSDLSQYPFLSLCVDYQYSDFSSLRSQLVLLAEPSLAHLSSLFDNHASVPRICGASHSHIFEGLDRWVRSRLSLLDYILSSVDHDI